MCKKLLILGIFLFSLNQTLGDVYLCYDENNCDPPGPALSNAEDCKLGQDYTISQRNNTGNSKNVTVLMIHGGRIEVKTSDIGKGIANRFNWDYYEFNGNGRRPECVPEGKTQYSQLHITSKNFDEPAALTHVQAHEKSVSIHGFSPSDSGLICVGGRHAAQRAAFVSYVEDNAASVEPNVDYNITVVDAPANDPYGLCEDYKGMLSANIVNKNSEGKGLQIELSYDMRQNLAEIIPKYNSLRDMIQNGVEEAMNA